MLTEEEWLSKYRHWLNSNSSSSSGSDDKLGSYNPDKQKAAVHSDKKDRVLKLTSEGTPHRKGHCRNCDIYGHWKQDCKYPRKDHREEAHHVKANVDQLTLLLTTIRIEKSHHGIASVETGVTHQVVHLNEDKVYPLNRDDDKDVWVLDTGASNHMTSRREVLALLDMSIQGTMHFRDGLLVEIEGIGSMMLQMKKVGHKVLTEVYFIPKLKSNIISIG
jgi:hypothetical protein